MKKGALKKQEILLIFFKKILLGSDFKPRLFCYKNVYITTGVRNITKPVFGFRFPFKSKEPRNFLVYSSQREIPTTPIEIIRFIT